MPEGQSALNMRRGDSSGCGAYFIQVAHGAAVIRGRRLFEVRCLIEETRYFFFFCVVLLRLFFCYGRYADALSCPVFGECAC